MPSTLALQYCTSVNLQFAKLEYAYIRNVTVVPYKIIHTHISCNAVLFMWGWLRLAPVILWSKCAANKITSDMQGIIWGKPDFAVTMQS